MADPLGGCAGDGRTYGHPIVLRPVSSEDVMTGADWTRCLYEVLSSAFDPITNEVAEVNRVVLTSLPPATIEG